MGNSTSRFLRLFCRAPLMTSGLPRPSRRFSGTGTSRTPRQVLGRSASSGPTRSASASPPPPPRRRARRRPARGRSPSRRRGSSPRRAPPRAPSCRGRASPGGWRAGGRCPLVEADRRLVEHVEHAHQLAADLGGQPDALALAAGERRRRAVERQVADPDVVEEAQPVLDLGAPPSRRSPARACRAAARPSRRGDPTTGRRDSSSIALPCICDRQRLRPQPPPLAGRAEVDRHELLDLGADRRRVGLLVAPVEHRDRPPRTCRSRSSSTSCP